MGPPAEGSTIGAAGRECGTTHPAGQEGVLARLGPGRDYVRTGRIDCSSPSAGTDLSDRSAMRDAG